MSLRPHHLMIVIALSVGATGLDAQVASGREGPRLAQARAGASAHLMSPLTAPVAAPVVDARALTTSPAAVPQPAEFRRRGVPQMIVGGAALVVGAAIGDDAGAIISLAGLAYGLYGLYLYLS